MGSVTISLEALSRRRLLAGAVAAVGLAHLSKVLAQRLLPLDLGPDGNVPFFIAPGQVGSGYREADQQLAVWALGAWQRASAGALSFERTNDQRTARVRVHWAEAADGQYGEMLALDVSGRRGAAVFIRPDTAALGDDIAARAAEDELFRDTIVYLTCLHELGHALGLEHTDDFADIMYFFGYGGDIPEYFGRYRRRLRDRRDIGTTSALSAGDIERLRALYKPRQEI